MSTRDKALHLSELHIAEEATGIQQLSPLRLFQQDVETPIDAAKARELLEAGEPIHVPAAGAGSYRQVISLMGLEMETLWDSTSSAGDWTIKLKDGRGIYQENRHPRYGFTYTMIENPCWEEEE